MPSPGYPFNFECANCGEEVTVTRKDARGLYPDPDSPNAIEVVFQERGLRAGEGEGAIFCPACMSYGVAQLTEALSALQNDSITKQQLPDRLKTIDTQTDWSARVFCRDEYRVGLIPVSRWRLTGRGTKPIRKQKPGYKYFYLHGAIEPETGQRFFLNKNGSTAIAFGFSSTDLPAHFHGAGT
jgi:DNA replicative helicase MCM subunit Mcm2 (Cdc46/Mcm family)